MRLTSLIAIALPLAGCSHQTAHQPEGFELVDHRTGDGTYTFVWRRVDGGRYVTTRLTGTCSYYKWGNREPVESPTACALNVGRLYQANSLKTRGKDEPRLDIFFIPVVLGDRALNIVEGEGDDQTTNSIEITEEKLLAAVPKA